ncbi:hypothetical protein D3C75_706880 [compost metagenome]
MRRIGNGLDRFFERAIPDLIEGQRQNNRQRKPDRQFIETDAEGVPQQIPEKIGIKKPFKMVKTNPRAARDSFGRHKILKSDLDAVHRAVMKDEEIQQSRSHEQIELPVLPDPFTEGLIPLHFSTPLYIG